MSACQLDVLDLKSLVGASEKTILIDSVIIMLAIVVPTVVATLGFTWRFRASNKRAVYLPNWAHPRLPRRARPGDAAHDRLVFYRRNHPGVATEQPGDPLRTRGRADQVHLVFLLQTTTSADKVNNIMALAFGVLIVGGSL